MVSSFCRSATRRRTQAGFGRTEALVLFFVLILAAVAIVAPFEGFLENSRLARGVDCARTLSTLLSQYSVDNNGTYPAGEGTSAPGKSEGIALNLLQNNFTPDASVFAVGSTPAYSGKATDYSDLTAANMSWDFTAGANATTGIPATAPDSLPIVYTTGQQVTYPTTPDGTTSLPLTGNGPFGLKGMVVAYKNNSAQFISAANTGAGPFCPGFFPPEFKDTTIYTQIKP